MNVFLYRVKDSKDRDCCVYVEPPRFECGHYFRSLSPHGACYSGGEFKLYDEIETVLSEDEYLKLLALNNEIRSLEHGITMGDDRYQKGMELCAEIQTIFDKLSGPIGQAFFNEIIESEKEYLDNTESLTREEIDELFDAYPLEYQDRSIFSCVYEDEYELGEDEAWNLGIIGNNPEWWSNYFDFEKFGADVADDECHCRFSSGRIASMMM